MKTVNYSMSGFLFLLLVGVTPASFADADIECLGEQVNVDLIKTCNEFIAVAVNERMSIKEKEAKLKEIRNNKFAALKLTHKNARKDADKINDKKKKQELKQKLNGDMAKVRRMKDKAKDIAARFTRAASKLK